MLNYTRHAQAGQLAGFVLLLSGCASLPPALDAAAPDAQADLAGKIAPYQPRPGHMRPTIAVLGENKGTELNDFVVPYDVLSESGVADVVTVSSKPGPITTFTDMGKPGFRIVAQATMADFDAAHPDGADYVVVPALHETKEIRQWLVDQAGKGATLVSICNGGMVVADTGIMKGRRATAHWSTEDHRVEHHADVRWVRNARYVADGNWVSSAGLSAAMPTSVALVEAIAGHDRAAALAQRLGVDDWSARHDSDAFQLHWSNGWPLLKVAYANHWLHADEAFGVPAATGVDEASLAMTIDAYSSTGRSQAYLLASSDAPLRTRHGLTILPDRVQAASDAIEALPPVDGMQPGKAFDKALDGIAGRYGRATAFGTALLLEYPGYKG